MRDGRDFWFDDEHGDKWRGTDGSECTYDEDGNLTDEGSFNFTPDYRPESMDNPLFWKHIYQDVAPWLNWGSACHAGQTTVYDQ